MRSWVGTEQKVARTTSFEVADNDKTLCGMERETPAPLWSVVAPTRSQISFFLSMRMGWRNEDPNALR